MNEAIHLSRQRENELGHDHKVIDISHNLQKYLSAESLDNINLTMLFAPPPLKYATMFVVVIGSVKVAKQFGFLKPIATQLARLLHYTFHFYGYILGRLGLFTVEEIAIGREEVIRGFPPVGPLLNGLPYVLEHELQAFLVATKGCETSVADYDAVPKKTLGSSESKWTNMELEGTAWDVKRCEYLSQIAPVLTVLLDNFREAGYFYYTGLLSLKPGHSIPRHIDISPLLRRLHVPLIVNKSGPVRMMMGDKWFTTTALVPYFFDQTVPHAVDNQMTNGVRINLVMDIVSPTKYAWLNAIHGALLKTLLRFYHQTGSMKFRFVGTDPLVRKLELPMGPLRPLQLAKFLAKEVFWHGSKVRATRTAFSRHPCLDDVMKTVPDDMINRLCGHMVTLHHSVQSNLYVPTMLNASSLRAIETFITHLVHSKVPGGFLEAGVWRGGGTILMKHLSNKLANGDRAVYVLDSFEGMENIESSREQDDIKMDKNCSLMLNEARRVLGSRTELIRTSEKEVRKNFETFLGPDYGKNVKFIKGWFGEEFPWNVVGQLAMIRLDVDYYKPTKIALEKLYDKLSVGGVVILDEYNLKFMGEHLAVDEFRASRGITSPIISTGPHSACFVKLEQ